MNVQWKRAPLPARLPRAEEAREAAKHFLLYHKHGIRCRGATCNEVWRDLYVTQGGYIVVEEPQEQSRELAPNEIGVTGFETFHLHGLFTVEELLTEIAREPIQLELW